MAKTEGAFRFYTCKCCGTKMKEPIRSWKKKSQKNKNVCPWCIDRRRIANQTRQEMREDAANLALYRLWPF